MSKTPILFILIAVLFAGMHPSCSAQNRRERGVQQFSLGIAIADVPANSPVKGVIVTSVTAGGLGDGAGLKAGDIIVSLGGQTVNSATDMANGLRIVARGIQIGQASEIGVIRDGNSVILTTNAGRTGAQTKGPKLGIGMKDAPKEWGIEGVLVSEVVVDSPADEAGIMPGDIVTEISGQIVKTGSDLQKVVSGLQAGRPYKISIRRGSQSINSDFTLRDHPAPGGAKRRLSDINVLKYAIIDPRSRAITLLGKYDPAYKTGPIPYYDLLKDAMRSPYPSFSLEPTMETRSGIDKLNASIGAEVQRMYSEPDYCNTWANRLMNLILNDPALQRDRARFTKKGAEAFKITEDEMLKVLSKSANASSVAEGEMIPILGKVLVGLGYEQVGAALLAQNEGSQASLSKLGISEESAAIVARFHSGEITKDRASLELSTLMESAILRGLRVSESDISSRANKVLSGQMSAEDYQKYMEERLMAIIVDEVGLKMFHGLTLSHELLCKLYGVPSPQMELVFKDVPAESILGDTLFRADYALKSICTNPEIKDSIPDFLTEIGYMYDASIKANTRIPGDAGAEVGHQLIPGEVRMRVSPSGNLVSFDDAQVKIIGWVIKTVGKRCTPEVANSIKTFTEEYGGYLTRNYEKLSGVFPELHRIREAEKLIALARWAKSNNYSIVVDRASDIRLAQSPTATGFWLAVFTADQQEFSLSVIAEGGATFDKNEGEEWIKPTVNSEVTSDVSKQLVMSAVLAKQAADAAIDGNMAAARDLADKSARAMTGDIDLTQLPSLGDLPMPSEPAQTAMLSNEALSAIDENMRTIENTKITMQKASDLDKTSPEEAAKLRDMAEAQRQQADANLKSLRDALDAARKDPGKTSDAVVTIRGLGKVIPSSSSIATNPQPISPGGQPVVVVAPQPAAHDDITPEQRKKWLAELASLEKELEATKEQFGKLSKSIQQDRQQFEDWEKVATDGMNKCRDVFYSLLMDASAGGLSDRYDQMSELAKKLPDNPQNLIDKLGRIKNWFTAMKYTQTFKDVNDMAGRDGKTLPELLEEVRDDLNIVISLTPLDKTAFGAAWKYGSNIVDMAYSFAQFSAAYDGIGQMDKNNDGYRNAVASLTIRMQTLVNRTNEIKKNLGG
ncbi:MAG: PDZ domain-containing protein [Armatimonadota bacterium]|nr:PDZ domain-containing protein [Armatimonadota bacterium]